MYPRGYQKSATYPTLKKKKTRAKVNQNNERIKLTKRQIVWPGWFSGPRQWVVESAAAVHCLLGIVPLLVCRWPRLCMDAFTFHPHTSFVLVLLITRRVQFRGTTAYPLPRLLAVTLVRGWQDRAGRRGCRSWGNDLFYIKIKRDLDLSEEWD